ncbi:MAG: PAC2 family protein [Phycisphaerae bacterium]|jgi:hypothetical protein
MAKTTELRDPWLVAVWPGMGSVAVLAGSHLVQQLGAEPVAALSASEFFELQSVQVKDGLASPAPLPRSLFFEWRDPQLRHDLLIFVGEEQPSHSGYLLCQKVIEYAASRGVRRLFTFAAMATQLQLGTRPKVFAAATDPEGLAELRRVGVQIMSEGQISGLNGVLLAAGAERGLKGICLLGELPFFAVGVPNPRASLAVLEPFSRITGIPLDFTQLKREARAVEKNLRQLLEQMSHAAGQADPEAGEEWKVEEDEEPDESEPPSSGENRLDPRLQQRIERLFERAARDRSKALELKQELDRLGVFQQYEDRFLDLFRKAE